jgi:hypothetical protein
METSNEKFRLLSRQAADITPAIRANGADTAFIAAELSIFPPWVLGFRNLIF